MWVADKWSDYELLDCSGGEKLERWGRYILVRPDPQAIWRTPREHPGWQAPDAYYMRSQKGGGRWEQRNAVNVGCRAQNIEKKVENSGELHNGGLDRDMPGVQGGKKPGNNERRSGVPAKWQIGYGDAIFNVSLMNFKHTGLFPEQAVNWEFISDKIRSAGRKISVLNLFAYTGGATLAAAAAGASVCHVDAARGMVQRARENAKSSGLEDKPVRWIVDDCAGFVGREIRRGHKYDALIMDPPSYGRGPGGEEWKLEDMLYDFMKLCAGALSDDPLFVLINSYTTGLSPLVLSYITQSLLGGCAESGEIGLTVASSGLTLPCGATCRWQKSGKI